MITRMYQWNFKGTSWSWKLTIPKTLYDYYRGQSHNRPISGYGIYVISPRDKPYLDAMLKKFRDTSVNKEYSESDSVLNVIAFIQALPYFKDRASTIYDNYPRYPVETLVDNGGDCEDTAILTAAILKEMGYGVVLINPPNHMALGIKCSSCTGTYYMYQGNKYFYIETTGENWMVGQLPAEYKNQQVKIIPLS